MSEREPTMNLRFVRDRENLIEDGIVISRAYKTLQQQWVRYNYFTDEVEYEWRDVPEVDDE
jgi:hypothetical protein